MPAVEIVQLPVLNDNYIYVIHDSETGATAAVDPALAQPVLSLLNERDWRLSHILVTHHHKDHTGGVAEIGMVTRCTVVAGRLDAARVGDTDIEVGEGDVIELGRLTVRVIDVPGHTAGHVAYWIPEADALFCGDTLFSLGCGRIFEGSAGQLWNSLTKLRALPDSTRVFCAHEYTNANADFALGVDPHNAALRARADEALRLRESGQSTVPSLLGQEKLANPFLRADQPDLQRAVGMGGLEPSRVFAEIRARKDRF